METQAIRTYRYRWVVLAVFALVNAVVQLQWITFAPITVDCIVVYHTTAFWIVGLSMSFMVVYLIMSVPASFLIDKFGIRIGVGIGAALMGLFGYLRGAFGADFTMVVVSQLALAVAQPFVMNAVTKVAAEWFPIGERATASGVTALAQFLGIIVAMALTKPLAQSLLPAGESTMLTLDAVRGVLWIYGVISLTAALLFFVFVRNRPPTPPCREGEMERYGLFEGLGKLFRNRDMIFLILIFFIGLGIFNAITTFVDVILASKGFSAGGNEAGNVGAVMLAAGVVGAIVIPSISDRLRRRKALLLVCMFGMLPGLAGFTFSTGYLSLLVWSGVFGFFFMAAAPLGYQYAAEVGYPTPESTSQGIIILGGQLSGTIFIVLMAVLGNITIEVLADANKLSGAVVLMPFLIAFVVLSVLNVAFGLLLKESKMIRR